MIRLKDLLLEKVLVKNKKSGNIYFVKKANPNKHDPVDAKDAAKFKEKKTKSKASSKKSTSSKKIEHIKINKGIKNWLLEDLPSNAEKATTQNKLRRQQVSFYTEMEQDKLVKVLKWQNEWQQNRPKAKDSRRAQNRRANKYISDAKFKSPIPLMRGQYVRDEHVEFFIENFRDSIGKPMTMPPSGFTTKPSVAAKFAQGEGDGQWDMEFEDRTPVILRLNSKNDEYAGLQLTAAVNYEPNRRKGLTLLNKIDWESKYMENEARGHLYDIEDFANESEVARAGNAMVIPRKISRVTDRSGKTFYVVDLEEAGITDDPDMIKENKQKLMQKIFYAYINSSHRFAGML